LQQISARKLKIFFIYLAVRPFSKGVPFEKKKNRIDE
jgi:hypothetical protein